MSGPGGGGSYCGYPSLVRKQQQYIRPAKTIIASIEPIIAPIDEEGSPDPESLCEPWTDVGSVLRSVTVARVVKVVVNGLPIRVKVWVIM